jgi:hypothetical protein
MLHAPSWKFHFWAHLSELARLRSIREADWSARRALKIGEAGGIPVYWCIEGSSVNCWRGIPPRWTIRRVRGRREPLCPLERKS